jgi:hypothetical protein
MVGLNDPQVNWHGASRLGPKPASPRILPDPVPMRQTETFDRAGPTVKSDLVPGVIVLLLVAFGAGLVLLLRRRHVRRGSSLRNLLDLADRLEADLKTCRAGLQQAHAVMSLNPDLPAASEQDARHAIDAGLRALLQQRLWIRDRSAQASQQELDEAATSMRSTRDRLQPLLQALDQAQIDLNSAMREHIKRESDT